MCVCVVVCGRVCVCVCLLIRSCVYHEGARLFQQLSGLELLPVSPSPSHHSAMELKVWVEGIQRVVCGVCDRTTCQVCRLLFLVLLLCLKISFLIFCGMLLSIFIRMSSMLWPTQRARRAASRSSNVGAAMRDSWHPTNTPLR